MSIGLGAAGTSAAGDAEVIVASGTLDGVAGALFHIGGFWMRVLGAVTFETADFGTVTKFEAYDDTAIKVVIKIEIE